MLYHKDVFIPKELKLKLNFNNMPITYSRHAIIASQSDRYAKGGIKLNQTISFKSDDIIEIETNHLKGVVKLVVRLSYNDKLDIIYVIMPGGFVKTVWLNLKSDNHKTLNVNSYARAV